MLGVAARLRTAEGGDGKWADTNRYRQMIGGRQPRSQNYGGWGRFDIAIDQGKLLFVAMQATQ